MSDKNKHRLIVAAIIGIVIVLWFWARKNPTVAQIIQQAADNVGLPELGLLPINNIGAPNIDVNISGYTPHDYPLPALSSYDGNPFQEGCSFCSTSRTTVVPPSPPVKIEYIPAKEIKPARYGAGSMTTWAQPSPARPPQRMFQYGDIGGFRNY
jgi:hypothetical protein